MPAIKLTIDGHPVEVAPGSTILDAARKLEIDIPTFCHNSELARNGACRICVVEVEKARTLVAACSAPAAPGMVVHTATERVLRARRVILRLILANHPLECITCEKNGACKLQEYCYRYDVSSSGYSGEMKALSLDDSNAFFVRDMNKCILCGICVGTCHEINGAGAIDFVKRGFVTNVAPPFGDAIEQSTCNFCGMCIDNCPVGALTPKLGIGLGRPWEIEKVKTICPYCSSGCSVYLEVKDGRVIGASPDQDSPVNRGQLCARGRFGWDFIHSAERLTRPLVKQDGVFVEVDWDEALDRVAAGLEDIICRNGAAALAGLGSGKNSNEENYLFQKLIRSLGSNNIDHYHVPGETALAAAFGSGAMTNSIGEITGADAILVLGADISETHPVIGYRVRQAIHQGTQLIVAGPRQTELALEAGYHLQMKPGTAVALVNGLVKVIIDEELYDREFIEERTGGFDRLKTAVAIYTPAHVAGVTGVPADDLRAAARAYATAEKAMILYATGEVTRQQAREDDILLALANLALVTGNIGRPSSGVNPLCSPGNAQGACDMGVLPGFLTAFQKADDPAVQRLFADAWGIELDDRSGLTASQALEAARAGTIKGMFIMGENPVLHEAGFDSTIAALQNLEFLVVQDLFLTETAACASVVLPAAAYAECYGTYTNTARRVQLSHPAVAPPGHARPGWAILTALANRFGLAWPYRGPEDVFNEMTALTPAYAGLSYARLEQGGLQWPCPDRDHPGTAILHRDRFVREPGLFIPVQYQPSTEEPDPGYPFLLSTGRHPYHYHGTASRRVTSLEEYRPGEPVQIHPDDAARLSLTEGDLAAVTSHYGTLQTKVTLTDSVAPGQIHLAFRHRETVANFYCRTCAVSVHKIS